MENIQAKEIQTVPEYFSEFVDKEGHRYGVRVARVDDAENILNLYSEIYGSTYFDPDMNNISILKSHLENPNEFWFVGIHLVGDTTEIVGSGTVKKVGELTLAASKAVIAKKFQKRGVGNTLGTRGILYSMKLPNFKNTIRLSAEARAFNLYAQKVMEKAGTFVYGFNPIYMSYGKRDWEAISEETPYLKGNIEPAIYYLRPLSTFWKKRDKDIYLLDNEDIIFFYYTSKKKLKKMGKDQVTVESKNRMRWQDCEVITHPEFGGVFIKGYVHKTLLAHYLYRYSSWRYIEWKVPTTELGLDSMKLALDRGFKVIGYDVGSLYTIDGKIVDCVIFLKPLKNLKFEDFSQMNVTPQAKIYVDRVFSEFKNSYEKE